MSFRGYTAAPPMAWAGWRLNIPGGPEGGQYHGFLAGGTALDEGETVSDYVYRGPAEVRPRANASGEQNVIHSLQTARSAGYAEAPGNYRALGAVVPLRAELLDFRSPLHFAPRPAPRPILPPPTNGATAKVAQPPPPAGPGGTVVSVWSVPPISPAPAPTVAASPADYLPSQGQSVPGITPSSSISDWLAASTIYPGVKNQWIALGAVAALLFLGSGGKGGRR